MIILNYFVSTKIHFFYILQQKKHFFKKKLFLVIYELVMYIIVFQLIKSCVFVIHCF